MLSSSAAVAEASQSAMSPAPTSTYDAAAAVTVRADVPVTVSDVAAMLAVPAVTPLTIPLPVTVATAVLFDAQATVRPVSVLPFASLRVAVSWTVWPVGTEAGAGVTVTEATGAGAGAVTVMAEVPLLPSLVAVIVAEPAVTPVTSPLPPTVATALLLLAQVTVRPLSGFPFASFGVAASCTVWPACTDAVAGLTVTDATSTVLTVIVAVPPCPSLVAVIVAELAVTPVTSPLPLTVATAVLLLAQLTARPDNGLPFASLGVAASCTVWPTCTDADAGLTATDATGTLVTKIAAVPLFPSLVAVSVAAPTATPVACPAPFTVATPGLLLDQVTVRPPSGLPNASRVIAAYCAVCPTPIVAVAGVTLTDATGSGHPVTVTLAAMETFPGWLVAVTVKVPQVALV